MATSQAPVERLPDDVLRNIFRLCFLSNDTPAELNPLEAPVLLTHITRRWRSVSVDYGVLWASLKFSHTLKKVPWTFEKVQAYAAMIERSKEAPLRLHISVTHRKQFTADAPNIVQSLIVPPAHHLRSLALKCINIKHLHALPPGVFPQLESLAMAFNPKQLSKFDWETQGPIQAFAGAPSLRRLALKQRQADFEQGHDFDWSSRISLPWRQVLHMMDDDHFDGANIPTACGYIERCPELQHLFITLHGADVGGGARVRAKSLKSLAFQSLFGAEWPVLLNKIDTPNLESMYFTGNALEFRRWAGGQTVIDQFLGRLRALEKLSYLSISGSGVSPTDLRSILDATARVHTLDLAVGEVHLVLQALALPSLDPGQGVLPHLRTIIIEDLHGLRLKTFLAFLISRCQCPPEHQLQKVVVYFRMEKYLQEGQPALEVIRGFAPGLELETHVAQDRHQWRHMWMDRDQGLQEWKEAVEIIAGMPRPEDDWFGVRSIPEDELDSD